MTNVKVSALPAVTTIANGDTFPLVSGGVTTKAPMGQTGTNYVPYVNSSGHLGIGIVPSAPLDISHAAGETMFLRKTGGEAYVQLGSATVSYAAFDSIGSTGGLRFYAGNGTLAVVVKVEPSGLTFGAHNTYDIGTTAVRAKDLWLQSGAFNGSDARLKTEIRPFTAKEIEASKQLLKEIGTYQWLESVKEKGADKARHHIGTTVQKAIEIMEANGLNPFDYGFIGYDKWDDTVVHHDEIKASEAQPAELDEAGNVVKEAVPEVKPVAAWDEVVLKAGDAFSFRYDQLNQFIARGIEARLTEIESRLIALEL